MAIQQKDKGVYTLLTHYEKVAFMHPANLLI
jgi:hypothetical protein